MKISARVRLLIRAAIISAICLRPELAGAQRTVNCSAVNLQSSLTNTATDIMTRIVACVNLVGALGGGVADARDMNANTTTTIISPPAANATFTLGAKNVTLLLGDYPIIFSGNNYSTTPPIIIPVSATGFSMIGLGGGGRSGLANTVFDFSGIILQSSPAPPSSMIVSNCPSACTFAGFRIKGNIAQAPGSMTPVTGTNGFATGGAVTTLTLDGVDVTNSSNHGIVLGGGGAGITCTDCTVRNSYVSTIWQTGIVGVNVTNFKAINNVVLDTALSIVTFPGVASAGGFGIHTLPQTGSATPSSYVVIKDNYVGTSSTGSSVCTGTVGCNQGIQTDGSAHCTIADNYVVNTQKEAIATSCTDVLIQGNHINNQVWPIGNGTGCVSIFGAPGTSPTAPLFNGQFVVRDNVCNVNIAAGPGGYAVQIHNGNTVNGGNGFTDMSNGVVSGNIGSGNFMVGLQLTMLDTTTRRDSGIVVHDNAWFSSSASFQNLNVTFGGSTPPGTALNGNMGWWGNRDTLSTVSVPNPNISGTPSVSFTFSEAAVAMQEQSAGPPLGTGIDALWADSTTHTLKMNPNNSTTYMVEGVSGALTAGGGTLPKFDTNGFLTDSNVPATSVAPVISGSGGGYVFLPWIQLPQTGGSSQVVETTANTLKYVRVVIPVAIKVSHIAVNVTATSGGKFGVGLMSADGTAVVKDFGPIACGTGGAQVNTLGTPFVVQPGTYLFAWGGTDTTCAVQAISQPNAVYALFNINYANSGTGANAINSSTGALPSSAGTLSQAQNPIPIVSLEP